nr:hypothetical protein [Maritimibacter sp. DP1N21-5]
MSCRQIETKAREVAAQTSAAAGVQDQNASRDAIATGVAVVLFWPAAFFVGGNDQAASQLALYKGQMNARQIASESKNCGLVFKTVEPNA